MVFNKFFFSTLREGIPFTKDFYVSLCLVSQWFIGFSLSEIYGIRIVGVSGPSMVPALEPRDNLVMVDCFTAKFIRNPRKGEVVMCRNPYKPNYTIIKRVINTEGEEAELFSAKEGRTIKV